MAAFTQLDLLQWLVGKDRPLGDRLVNLKANPAGARNLDSIAETNHERALIANLADLVRASGLPKHPPGLVGRPQPPRHEAGNGIDATPVTSLSEVMDLDEEVAATDLDLPAPPPATSSAATPPAPIHPAHAAIAEAGAAKLAAQKKERLQRQAQAMRDAHAAKRAAAKVASA